MRALLTGGKALVPTAGTLLELLQLRAEEDRQWLIFHQGRRAEPFTARDLLARAAGWAAGMDAASGTRIGIWQPNGPDFVAAFFGAMGAGATPVPLPWPVLEADLPRGRERIQAIIDRAGLAAIAAPPQARTRAAVPGWILPEEARAFPHRPAPEAPAFIQFTSGSTGVPRGAVISHRAALYNATALVAGLRLGPDDLGVSWIPFFHDMGLVGVLLASLVGGFPVHILRPSEFLLHPWTWLEAIAGTRATVTVAPDFGYAFAARRHRDRPSPRLASLRCALTGSEPIHAATLEAFGARFARGGFDPNAFTGAYGLAENTLAVCAGPALAGGARPSVGTPLPGMEVSLAGPQGEICVRSPSLMTGYFDAPEESARALEGGWLRTGDLGRIDDGRLTIVGREKELVIKAGQKLHPSEIEQLVAGRVDAPINGVAAFNADDGLVLVIEQRRAVAGDTAGVRALIAAQLGVRVDRVEWVASGTLPRTTSGKLRRAACAEQFGAPS